MKSIPKNHSLLRKTSTKKTKSVLLYQPPSWSDKCLFFVSLYIEGSTETHSF